MYTDIRALHRTIGSLPAEAPKPVSWDIIRSVAEAPGKILTVNELREDVWPCALKNPPLTMAQLKETCSKEAKPDVNVLTRSGLIHVLPPKASKNPIEPELQPSWPVLEEANSGKEDPILTQLKQTQAKISLWSLLTSSYPHKLKLVESFCPDNGSVDATPEEVIQMIGNIHYGNIITFTNLDLPKFGANHNEPLYITVQLDLLDIKPTDMKPSVHTVKAYDSTYRTVHGVATLNIWFGKRMMPTEF